MSDKRMKQNSEKSLTLIIKYLIMKALWYFITKTQNKQTPWPLVRKRTIPTERPPLVDEI
jgi:hypothetical protein